jgi:transposase-like protein
MGGQTKLSSPQERLELILLGISRQQTVENLCSQAGVSRELFYRWMKLVQGAALRVLEAKQPGPKALSPFPEKQLQKLQAQVDRQGAELAKLRKERNYLKLVVKTGQRIIRRNAWGPFPKVDTKKNSMRPKKPVGYTCGNG